MEKQHKEGGCGECPACQAQKIMEVCNGNNPVTTKDLRQVAVNAAQSLQISYDLKRDVMVKDPSHQAGVMVGIVAALDALNIANIHGGPMLGLLRGAILLAYTTSGKSEMAQTLKAHVEKAVTEHATGQPVTKH